MHPLIEEIPYRNPLDILRYFADDAWTAFLHSGQILPKFGRYSLLAIDPFETMTVREGHIVHSHGETEGNPFDWLQNRIKAFPLPAKAGLPTVGGAFGFMSYEAQHYLESLPAFPNHPDDFPDMAFGFYDLVILFDQIEYQACIVSSGYPEKEEGRRFIRAQSRMQSVLTRLQGPLPDTKTHFQPVKDLTPDQSPESYQQQVARLKEDILNGDIFEANFTQGVKGRFEGSAYGFYQALTAQNPAPFSSYLNVPNAQIVSASPERFVEVNQGVVKTHPIKGTIARVADPKDDQVRKETLIGSEKDRAENIMIVDLMRNDLSRVCRPGSIEVTALCQGYSFQTVHHLVSTVEGTLKPGVDCLDVLKVSYPGGSITGAPKIRAMELIQETEMRPRGPYCGIVGYLGFDGNMDTAISIRTAGIRNGAVFIHGGGAITLQSDPAGEYDECLVKLRALQRCLEGGGS